ncbi:hypothetical protein BJ138DRAFT_1151558 [Hygrophoropsis aurantiaca]|uniref:Uncharacterized protein n=1 Tax=Hygrophoropsis aurantiaca TaxID=72124 RepID=A0ACB8AD46_9AGAM|nr:hypothetical protein BJ138DRAFT_1151558 [Hygrophoropsis aurantiaca]
MAMEIAHEERSILEWDEDQVHQWLCSLGYPQYQNQIKEHNISGDALCLLDPEGLKAIGIATVGQRLAILKAVYQAKLAHQIPIEPGHYIPPSEAQEKTVSVDKLFDIVKEQAHRVQVLEDDNRRLSDALQILLDEVHSPRSKASDEPSLRRQHSYKWAQYPAKSPTKADSPHPSPQQVEHDQSQIPTHSHSHSQTRAPPPPQIQIQPSMTPTDRHPRDSPGSAPLSSASAPLSAPPTSATPSTSSSATTSRPHPSRTESVDNLKSASSSDNLKSFKVSLEDPTWKVLPAALKKYKINNDTWQNYAMFICYGSPGNRIERCLSYDEKPLLLFQKLKDAKKNPVFMLKHIKDIRSPIAVAQQKHAMRKASGSGPSGGASGNQSQTHGGSGQQSNTHSHTHHPNVSTHLAVRPKLDTQQPLTGTTPQAGWPEVTSPTLGEGLASTSTLVQGSTENGSIKTASTLAHGSMESGSLRSRSTATSAEGESTRREMPPPMAGVSYAVAIYPYMAEQDDEFDVVVGDTFVILSRARGWWVVQRDPTGSGIVDTDTSKQGWVPAGCLLETNVPVASAIAEATAASSSSTIDASSDEPPVTGTIPGSTTEKKTPILPLSIISTSFPGVALMEYKKKGEEELDLAKDDALRVFKRYNHWSYAVKEEGGDRGWVPSWFIGKVPAPGGAPPTPALPPAASVSLDQVSPMSSAFPLGRNL